MSREIKFRAWDTKKKRFDSEPLICRGKCCFIDSFDNFEEYEEGRMLLGQFTGLKDKNGKEIYEGDIVKCTNDADEISPLNSDTGIGAVEYWELGTFWNVSIIENSLGELGMNGYVEVIGNIYENAELLAEVTP